MRNQTKKSSQLENSHDTTKHIFVIENVKHVYSSSYGNKVNFRLRLQFDPTLKYELRSVPFPRYGSLL
ncbi:hypothetical protein LEP1GSC062_3508 [Leptospira alexanderi serovar Manhao 3 str. L 60]|uniref:Uncharacterized protein n=1 Tax=Leptospira alexanderi serovar Manhao 3 str. L 60 TaxID=1049759 RepID=V6HZ91_9LEPT|nr:hypothetical protein LEP1GSC062_3508 [Leptospira alexanderi serovar Manhao 3 str. L 60]